MKKFIFPFLTRDQRSYLLNEICDFLERSDIPYHTLFNPSNHNYFRVAISYPVMNCDTVTSSELMTAFKSDGFNITVHIRDDDDAALFKLRFETCHPYYDVNDVYVVTQYKYVVATLPTEEELKQFPERVDRPLVLTLNANTIIEDD